MFGARWDTTDVDGVVTTVTLESKEGGTGRKTTFMATRSLNWQ
jgi:hypothetical protein